MKTIYLVNYFNNNGKYGLQLVKQEGFYSEENAYAYADYLFKDVKETNTGEDMTVTVAKTDTAYHFCVDKYDNGEVYGSWNGCIEITQFTIY